jgi:hypothetical protein
LLEFSPNRNDPSEAGLEPALTVIVAVAFPLASNVTELELNEQVGAPVCAGCTSHASETGLSNALGKLSETVEVALWPRLKVLGSSTDAETRRTFQSTALALRRTTTRSMASTLAIHRFMFLLMLLFPRRRVLPKSTYRRRSMTPQSSEVAAACR